MHAKRLYIPLHLTSPRLAVHHLTSQPPSKQSTWLPPSASACTSCAFASPAAARLVIYPQPVQWNLTSYGGLGESLVPPYTRLSICLSLSQAGKGRGAGRKPGASLHMRKRLSVSEANILLARDFRPIGVRPASDQSETNTVSTCTPPRRPVRDGGAGPAPSPVPVRGGRHVAGARGPPVCPYCTAVPVDCSTSVHSDHMTRQARSTAWGWMRGLGSRYSKGGGIY